MRHTREEIAQILKDIAPPGKKREDKIKAIEALNLRNTQGINVVVTLETYEEF